MDRNKDLNNIPIRNEIGDVVEYLNNTFKKAIDLWCSDIHIEPTEHFMIIRFRKDWEFLIIDKINKEHTSIIVTRLKVLSKVKIDESKKPQDWKILYLYEQEKENIDIRLSTLPTNYWEKVVMRILKKDKTLTNIEALWLIDVNTERVKEALKSKYWIILIAWPTGSGKSTTLFWVLRHFQPLDYNISTLEDPIEYNIDYVNQSQVQPSIWYTFSTGLRSLVRQDPDIIMVWEIRDSETATLAVEAALTWHLVLSTIHTNSATWTIQRLLNMEIEPFLLASAMKMVISQRLLKRICTNCKVEYKLKDYEDRKVKEILSPILEQQDLENLTFYEGKWCEKCLDSWYSWRLWIHEVLIVEEYLESFILEKASANTLKNEAVKKWMVTILQDALLKALLWKTTVIEALKLI